MHSYRNNPLYPGLELTPAMIDRAHAQAGRARARIFGIGAAALYDALATLGRSAKPDESPEAAVPCATVSRIEASGIEVSGCSRAA